MKHTAEQLRQARARYWAVDPRKRFAYHANQRVAKYGRPDDRLDWTTIPEGPWSCHNCGVSCYSWDHLEPLSTGGANDAANLVSSCVPCNMRRTAKALRSLVPFKTYCKRGHEYTPENTRIGSQGERRCRGCARIYALAAYYRKRAVA